LGGSSSAMVRSMSDHESQNASNPQYDKKLDPLTNPRFMSAYPMQTRYPPALNDMLTDLPGELPTHHNMYPMPNFPSVETAGQAIQSTAQVDAAFREIYQDRYRDMYPYSQNANIMQKLPLPDENFPVTSTGATNYLDTRPVYPHSLPWTDGTMLQNGHDFNGHTNHGLVWQDQLSSSLPMYPDLIT